MKKKVVSFSLWGDIPRYTIGAIKNADLALKMYPDFECWFFVHKETVPENIITELNRKPNVKVILKYGNGINKPMCWRFEAIDDPNVDVMLSRDTDTRIFLREKLAVEDWLKNYPEKTIHIMRDHKVFHTHKIFGGMFGVRKNDNILNWTEIINSVVVKKDETRNYDLTVLNLVLNKLENNKDPDSVVLIHSPYKLFQSEKNVKDFPIPYSYDNYNFVGCYILEDDSRIEEHHKMLF